jgi:RNA polymerase sigma-70 factor (ECF subfamily)
MTAAGEETDEALMARLRAGQDSALNALMERWQIPLRSYLLRYLQNDVQALDIAEEVFVRIYRTRERFDETQRFSSWMFAIATNLARNQFRWRSRHPGESLDAPGSGALEGEEALRENSTPADRAAMAERADAVRDAISRLPDELRSSVLLFEYENLTHNEIARVLGCSAKAVEVRLYRARGFLKKALSRFMTESSRD